jgi:cyclophilin family peptidyl-prolyl cis-trans isomerase
MKSRTASNSRRSNRVALENLENRVLFAADITLTNAIADNRGEAILTVDSPLQAPTVSNQTVQMFIAGPSGNPANADHVKVPATVSYNSAFEQITIAAKKNLPTATSYEVVAKGSQILNTSGDALDGDGNGTPGGNYRIVTSIKNHKVAIFATQFGNMIVKLVDKSVDPNTTANFLHYANAGDWDGTFFNRLTNVSGDGIGVLQGGEFNVTSSNTFGLVPTLAPIPLEVNPGVESNGTVGTIAMARNSNPNSATNTFFFNYTSNAALDTENGGYAAFGAIAPSDTISLAVLQAIATNDTVNLRGIGITPTGQGTEFEEVPSDESNFDGNGNPIPPTPAEVAQSLDNSLIFLSRVSIEMNTGPAVITAIPAVATASINIPVVPGLTTPIFAIQTPDITDDFIPNLATGNTSPLFNDTFVTGGSSLVTDNSGTSTTTDTYVNGVLVSTTTSTTNPSQNVSGTLSTAGNNTGSIVGQGT